MKFFWRQPTYVSDLEHLFKALEKDDSTLPSQKKAGMNRLWDKAPFDMDTFNRNEISLLPLPANPYR